MHHTRQKIIDYLKEKEQATVDELANVVDLTPMAVRYHLNVLQSEKLIYSADVRRPAGRGRPLQVYALTDAADALFPVDYYGLTDYLLDELNFTLGQEGITDLFGKIANRLVTEAPPVKHNQTVEERLDDVVSFLTNKGFVVDWQAGRDAYFVHAYSCPYRRLAKEYDYVCVLDKQVISVMLNTVPTRIACLSNGDSHCTYRMSKSIELLVPN